MSVSWIISVTHIILFNVWFFLMKAYLSFNLIAIQLFLWQPFKFSHAKMSLSFLANVIFSLSKCVGLHIIFILCTLFSLLKYLFDNYIVANVVLSGTEITLLLFFFRRYIISNWFNNGWLKVFLINDKVWLH